MWCPKLDPEMPKQMAILEALRQAIARGEFKADRKLPSQRLLSYALDVNLSTVSRAFEEATREGLIIGEVGRGTFVLAGIDEAKLFRAKTDLQTVIDLSKPSTTHLDETIFFQFLETKKGTDPRFFDYMNADVLQHGEQMLRFWNIDRGVGPHDMPHLVLTAGAHAGLHAVLLKLVKPGSPILCEAFTFPGLKTIARSTRTKLYGVECDDQGLLPDALEYAVRRTSATTLVTVPNIQNPTGAVMGPERRRIISQLVSRLNLTVIEDDSYGALTHLPPLIAEMDSEHVCVGSLSKTVSPGLRVGYIWGRHPVVAALKQDPTLTSWPVSPLMLQFASYLISSGSAQEQVSLHANLIHQRWEVVKQILPDQRGNLSPFLWLPVPNLDSFFEQTLRECVKVVPSSLFAIQDNDSEFIRCTLTAPKSDAQLAAGLRKIRNTL